ncbi:MAG: hypothetical protein RLZZ221_459, partial [Verrucomicrobiota bacterium]
MRPGGRQRCSWREVLPPASRSRRGRAFRASSGVMSTARDSSPSRWEWVVAGLLTANLTVTLLANGGYGARFELLTSLGTAVLLAVYAASRIFGCVAARPSHPAGWLPLPFVAYAAVNVAWFTPTPWLGQRDLSLWMQMAAVFWVVLNGLPSRGPRRLVFLGLVAVALVGVVAGCYQVFVEPGWRLAVPARAAEQTGRATGSFSLANSFAGLILLLLPAIAARVVRPGTATSRVWWIWVGLVLSGWFSPSVAARGWPWRSLSRFRRCWRPGFPGDAARCGRCRSWSLCFWRVGRSVAGCRRPGSGWRSWFRTVVNARGPSCGRG